MTSTNEKSDRANIRIEIKNDLSESEAMDIDVTAENSAIEAEIEDGEISDCKENEDEDVQTDTLFSNQNTIPNRNENQSTNNRRISEDEEFLDADEQGKLETRAKRFGIEFSSHDMLTDQQLIDLHNSLGITTEDEKINTRFEAIHMYGTQDMSTQDVYAYFGKYKPNSIEWINDESCNVVWLDKVTAARALNTLSRMVSGMPVGGACNPFEPKTNVKKNNGTSILLLDDASKRDNTIHVSELDFPIPPGYWRLGESSSKAKYILLRLAKRTDKKPFRAEKFSVYYRKHGNPNYGGIRGLISESKKARMKGEINFQKPLHHTESVKGNPWGRLAKDWNKDVLERPMEEVPSVPYQPKASKSLLNRLGTTTTTAATTTTTTVTATKKRSLSESGDEDLDEQKPVAKKSKVPRMRMYADEEEARITKMKELKKIRALEKIEENIVENHVPDLRSRLKRQKVISNVVQPPKPPITSRLRPIKQEIKVTAKNDFRRVPSESETSEEEDLNVQQRSKVTVIVKKQTKPTVASTIWSRLANEKRKKLANKTNVDSNHNSSSKSSSSSASRSSKNSGSDSSSNSSDSNKSDSDSDVEKNDFSKTLNPRPGFSKDLKSRLGLNNTDHKSPLRIEINNDHYNKTS